MYSVVIDTNVLVAALKSKRGASFRLLSLVGTGKFDISLSVPLLIEYEAVCQRKEFQTLTENDVTQVLNYLCKVADKRQIFFLWRPFLKDPKDDMILELAVEVNCDYIITYNLTDFEGIEQFGVKAITTKQFLTKIGEL